MRTSLIISGIDIGSHSLRMKIGEVKEDLTVKTLDIVEHPVSIGRDTFNNGKANFETVKEVCEALKGFKKIMEDYYTDEYRAVATSAVRDSVNKDYIIDQIGIKTGINIEVITKSEERFLTHKALRDYIPDYKYFRNKGTMIVDVGSGSLSISVYNKGTLEFNQNINIGSLRIREILSDIEGKTLNFPKVLEEYIGSNFDQLKNFGSYHNLKNLIVLGEGIRVIKNLIKTENIVSTKEFKKLYKTLEHKPDHIIINEYNVLPQNVNLILPTMIILKKVLELIKVKEFMIPYVSLADGILADMVDKRFKTIRQKEFIKDIVASARFLAERYRYDKSHSRDVENKALKIFDAIRQIHGLNDRHRLLLQLAAILHDTGKFLSLSQHYKNSYKIIMSSDLIGISCRELEIISNVAMYHSVDIPSFRDDNFRKLPVEGRMVVAKLSAILRLADALDRSHKQKIKDIEICLREDTLNINGVAVENTVLEEWTFEKKAEFFKEVFGLTPILEIKRVINYD